MGLEGSSTDVAQADKQGSSKGAVITQVEGTPFIRVLGVEQSFIALGQYRLTEGTVDEKKLNKLEGQLKKMDWEFMIAVIGAITKQVVETYREELKDEQV